MTPLLKKHSVKIPSDVSLIYTHKKKILTLTSTVCRKSIKLNVQLFIGKLNRTVQVSQLPFLNLVKSSKKKWTLSQRTIAASIKQSILEVSIVLYQKLKLVGVGYRIFDFNKSNCRLLLFKLGYSHFIYFKIIKNLNVLNFKLTKLFFFCNCFKRLTQVLHSIRALKKPEPYKGKGFLYGTEKINLKKGKKTQ